MKKLTENAFDQLTVIIAGEKLYTRPVEFTYDKHGDVVDSIKYHSTCPRCAQLIEFSPDDVYVSLDSDNKNYYMDCECEKCPVPDNCIKITKVANVQAIVDTLKQVLSDNDGKTIGNPDEDDIMKYIDEVEKVIPSISLKLVAPINFSDPIISGVMILPGAEKVV